MKNTTFLRILALALCALLLLGTFACGPNNEEDQNLEDENAVPAPTLTENDSVTVMTVGGNDVSLALYRYYFMNYKASLDGGDETVWASTPELADTVKTLATDNIKYQFAGDLLCEKYGITVSDDEKNAYVDEIMASVIENYGGMDAYLEELEVYYLTDKVFRDLNASTFVEGTLYTALYGEGGSKAEISNEAILEYVKENYVRAKHILISTEGLTDDEKAAKLADAQSIIDRINDGEDFDALRTEFSEDPGQPDIGYYFTTGVMVEEFENAAYALKIGELSEPVETSYGYHIILRLEMEDEHILANEELKSEAALYIGYEEFENEIVETAQALAVEYADNFDSYTAETLK